MKLVSMRVLKGALHADLVFDDRKFHEFNAFVQACHRHLVRVHGWHVQNLGYAKSSKHIQSFGHAY